MAILGTFVDKNASISLAGPTTTATINHSLGQQPDSVWIEPRSLGQTGAPGFWALANASITTFGTSASTTNALFDLFARYFHSIVR